MEILYDFTSRSSNFFVFQHYFEQVEYLFSQKLF